MVEKKFLKISDENIKRIINEIKLSDIFEKEANATLIPINRSEGRYKTRCIFHNDKNPSLFISDKKGVYHCFGCGSSGNVFTLIEKLKNYDFVQSFNYLARNYLYYDNYDYVVKHDIGRNKSFNDYKKEKKSEQKIINNKEKVENDYEINNKQIYSELLFDVTALYRAKLFKEINTNQDLLNYVKKRKLTLTTISKFYIGYAPNENLLLSEYGNDKETLKKLFDIGLIRQNEKGQFYDTFRNRLIIPSLDENGQVDFLVGRALDSESKFKYLYTKTKLENFYGLFWSKEYIEKYNSVVITEGQIDAISLMQEGINNVISFNGSSISEAKKNKLLSLKADTYILFFDSDLAGSKSMLTISKELLNQGKYLRLVFIPFKDGEKTDINDLCGKVNLRDYIIKNIYRPLDFIDKILNSKNIEEKDKHIIENFKNDFIEISKERKMIL